MPSSEARPAACAMASGQVPVSMASGQVMGRPRDTRVRAVQSGARWDFYLDLVGAVTVMALVLLAAILV